MTSFVVDASVVVEFLVPGRHGDEADRVIGTSPPRTRLSFSRPTSSCSRSPTHCANSWRDD